MISPSFLCLIFILPSGWIWRWFHIWILLFVFRALLRPPSSILLQPSFEKFFVIWVFNIWFWWRWSCRSCRLYWWSRWSRGFFWCWCWCWCWRRWGNCWSSGRRMFGGHTTATRHFVNKFAQMVFFCLKLFAEVLIVVC